MNGNDIEITPYRRKYREAILNLMFDSHRTHAHLDWFQIAEWLALDASITCLAWRNRALAGLISISAPLNRASWIRLIAVQDDHPASLILKSLWNSLQQMLEQQEINNVNILCVNEWVIPILKTLNFRYLEDVITLIRYGKVPPQKPEHPATIRPAYLEDLPAIVQVDHCSFRAPWQMTTAEIRQAQRYTASNTVAELNNRIVGYQFSTGDRDSGHLARLGVLLEQQGQKIGALLLIDLLQRFHQKGIHSITVNTQSSNIPSQRLYQRYGFVRSGFDLPVWTIDWKR